MYAQVKLLMAGKMEDFYNQLSQHLDIDKRVQVALQTLQDIVPLDVECDRKDAEVSDKIRKEADQILVTEKNSLVGLLHAWECYSKSIAFAKSNSRELALAYANRSAALYHLRKYEECIRDIDKTLDLNYPDSLRANLLRRKAKCLKLLGKPEAQDACQEAERLLQHMNLNNASKSNLARKIQVAKNINVISNIEQNTKLELPKIGKSNKKIPCASEAVEIKINNKYGRHLVATRDIAIGEILAIEKPYSLLLNPTHLYSHCSHCFKRAWDSIPCPHCVYAMYCSKKCKDDAWKQYHDIECPVKGYFLNLKMNDLAPFSLKIAVMAIREAAGFSKLRQQLEDIDKCEDN